MDKAGASNLANSIKNNDLFIEVTSFRKYNINGISYFEHERAFFKLLTSLGVKFSIGSDTHEDLEEVGHIVDEISFLEDIGAKVLSF
jgi:hypothetical protein